MPAMTPEFVHDLETNMKLITSEEYQRLNANMWWEKVAKLLPSLSLKERLIWLLDSAQIERGEAGNRVFEDMVSKTTVYENEFATAGLTITKEQFEDLDGNGVKLATSWSRQMGSLAAYWPQKVIAEAIRNNGDTYDELAFFHTAHPVNPFKEGAGTFANRFTGASSGAYPGACPIDASVSVEQAILNLGKAIAYVRSLKMPNGVDPRMLRIAGILHPPALTTRAQQITNAKFIAQSTSGGAGSGDVEAVVRNFGVGQPIEADELGAGFENGSDTHYYLLVDEITTNELGAITYVERESFNIQYHSDMDDSVLARLRKLQWLESGRNTVGMGHPYLMFRCEST
jgi:hypothetical protein